MSVFKLGTIDPMNVQTWDGFDYPERATVTPLLASSTTSTGNAVIQSSGNALREATISGTFTNSTDVSDLRGYYNAKSEATFTDSDGGTYSVRVFDLRISRVMPLVWNYSCRLVES